MKKIVALLLALAMLFALTACQEDIAPSQTEKPQPSTAPTQPTEPEPTDPPEPPKPSIVGTWVATIDISELVNREFGEGMEDYFHIDALPATHLFCFRDDGVVISSLDVPGFQEVLTQAMLVGYTEYLADNGVSLEDFQASAGMSLEEYIINEMSYGIPTLSYATSEQYELEGDKLKMETDDGWFTVEITEDTLEFTDYAGDDDEDMFGSLYRGVIFHRDDAAQVPVPDTSILGTWKAQIDYAETVKAMLEASDPELAVYFQLDHLMAWESYDFRDDDTCVMTVDFTHLTDVFGTALGQALTQLLRAEGVSAKDFQEGIGLTVEEFVDYTTSMYLYALSVRQEMEYYFWDGQLSFDTVDGLYTVELSEDALRFTAFTGGDMEGFERMYVGVDFQRMEEPDLPEPTASIVGNWVGMVNYAQPIIEYYQEVLDADTLRFLKLDRFDVTYTFEFNKDGTGLLAIDASNCADELYDVLEDGVIEMITANGMTVAEFEAQYSMTVRDFVDTKMRFEPGDLISSTDLTYELDGCKLYLEGNIGYYAIRLEEDTLEFVSYSSFDDDGEFEERLQSVIFRRQ